MRISFDFDHTLSQPRIQRLAKLYLEQGHNVCIITTRSPYDDNKDLRRVSRDLGIEIVIYTGGDVKWKYLHNNHIHYDDDSLECELIEENTNTIAVRVRP